MGESLCKQVIIGLRGFGVLVYSDNEVGEDTF
jgi:hypothetical protein